MAVIGPAELEQIRKTAIIGVFADEHLLNSFVLKGGNALNFAYNISDRSSIDVDLSMKGDFSFTLDEARERLKKSLSTSFQDIGYELFDFDLVPKPSVLSDQTIVEFWGGYQVKFKIAKKEVFESYRNELDNLRRRSAVIDDRQHKNFTIDISKYEYCDDKIDLEIDGYKIFVYTPRALVIEKLRAICQQMKAYQVVVPSFKNSPRARDFYDVYSLLEDDRTKFDPLDSESLELVRLIFAAKRVDIALLGQVEGEREYHRQGFQAVKDTVSADINLGEFDFYFDYIVNIANGILKKLTQF